MQVASGPALEAFGIQTTLIGNKGIQVFNDQYLDNFTYGAFRLK